MFRTWFDETAQVTAMSFHSAVVFILAVNTGAGC